MSHYIIVITKEIAQQQENSSQLFLPITRNLQERVNLEPGDKVLFFITRINELLNKMEAFGIYSVIEIQRKILIEEKLPIKIGTRFAVSFEKANTNFSSEVDTDSIIEFCRLGELLDLDNRLRSKIPIIINISADQFEKVSQIPFSSIKKLNDKFKTVGIRLQKKIGSRWIYDIDKKEIFSLQSFVRDNLSEKLVIGFINKQIAMDPEEADKYYNLIESFVDENILRLSWNNFEKRVTRLVSKMGFKAIKSQQTADGGVDIYVEDLKLFTRGKYIIQCKRTEKAVGVKDVKDLDSTVGKENAIKGILISASGFSKQAIDWAERCQNPIELLSWSNLMDYLENYDEFSKGNNK